MIAGQVIAFVQGDETFDKHVVVELTYCDETKEFVQIAFDREDERIYLKFRMSDLKREVKEY